MLTLMTMVLLGLFCMRVFPIYHVHALFHRNHEKSIIYFLNQRGNAYGVFHGFVKTTEDENISFSSFLSILKNYTYVSGISSAIFGYITICFHCSAKCSLALKLKQTNIKGGCRERVGGVRTSPPHPCDF